MFGLTYRATEGFLGSLIELNQIRISTPAPDYSTLCQKAKTLKVSLGAKSYLKNDLNDLDNEQIRELNSLIDQHAVEQEAPSYTPS